MRYLSKNEVADRLRFVESQTVFVLETTAKVNTAIKTLFENGTIDALAVKYGFENVVELIEVIE